MNIAADDVSTQILFAGVRFTLAGVLSIVFESIIERRSTASEKQFHWKYSEAVYDADGHPVPLLLCRTGTLKLRGVTGSIITGTNSLLTILIACFIFRQEKIDASDHDRVCDRSCRVSL